MKLEGLTANVTIEPNGLRLGLVFFRIEHPISKSAIHVDFLTQGEAFCKKHNLVIDPSLGQAISENLVFNAELNGWYIPEKFLSQITPITSASQYIKKHFDEFF